MFVPKINNFEYLTNISNELPYQHWFDHAPVGMFITNSKGKYVAVNNLFAQILGYKSSDDFLANYQTANYYFYVEPNRFTYFLELLNKNQKVFKFESQVYKRDGSMIWLTENVNPIYDHQGELIGYEGVIEDITERKEKELEMENNLFRLQELCEIKSKFVSMVSHEFRGGLSVILSSSDMLKVYGEKLADTQKQKHFDKINHQVEELTDLLEDLLQFGKIEASKDNLQQEDIDLENFCQEVMEDIGHINKKGNPIILNNHSGVRTILGDRLMMKRMVINLLYNAVKYSPDQGKIEFNVSDHRAEIMFQICDEGIGIPESEIANLYTSFYRCKNTGKIAGTGLGLSIVKKIVDLHQGNISVESTLGKGTTFTVSLPV